ncbi:DUF3558 domain-containing protein [Nocardia sp. NPDC052566]|uniref:DUF3558 domain-containing protein n=1 Tax=Nocardia sp. NPDC052566 TaxID=3364330 RepID=UPI0037C5F14F
MRASAGVVLMTAAIVAGPVLAGCDSSSNGGDKPAASTTGASGAPTTNASGSGLAKDVPTGFDPCTDIPADVLASEKLKASGRKDLDAPGGVKWRGCGWVRPNGYAVAIKTTNLTVQAVRDRNFAGAEQFTIAGRPAIAAHQLDDKAACIVNVEMKGGSLEFNLDNPPSRSETGKVESCQLARTLAEKVVPSVPASA